MLTPMRKLVFTVLAHQDPAMLLALCRSLDGHPVVVHLDAKAALEPFAATAGLEHVTIVEDRIPVAWGGFSMVEATLRLYREALRIAGDDDATIVLLSGSDYPVRPIAEFQEFVTQAKWSEHIRAVEMFDGSRYLEDRVRRRHELDRFPPQPSDPSWTRAKRDRTPSGCCPQPTTRSAILR
jgi:hypothetical protein